MLWGGASRATSWGGLRQGLFPQGPRGPARLGSQRHPLPPVGPPPSPLPLGQELAHLGLGLQQEQNVSRASRKTPGHSWTRQWKHPRPLRGPFAGKPRRASQRNPPPPCSSRLSLLKFGATGSHHQLSLPHRPRQQEGKPGGSGYPVPATRSAPPLEAPEHEGGGRQS